MARLWLANALQDQGQFSEAVKQNRRAMRIRPNSFLAANQLAWLLATCRDDQIRDAEEALRLAERVIFEKRIDSTPIQHPPIFILGHWRTGTTFLHSLLAQDTNLGHVSLFQTLAPASFFVGQRTLQPLAAIRTPETRPLATVHLQTEAPQGD